MNNRTSDGVEHHFAVNVPDDLRSRRAAIRSAFQLHGGVGGRATNAPVGTGTIGALAGAEQIYVVPYAWADAPWWSDDQVLNLAAIVDRLKRLYNVDENRVVVSGVSDGGTGALLRRDARDDAVRELPAAERLHDGAGAARHRRRR